MAFPPRGNEGIRIYNTPLLYYIYAYLLFSGAVFALDYFRADSHLLGGLRVPQENLAISRLQGMNLPFDERLSDISQIEIRNVTMKLPIIFLLPAICFLADEFFGGLIPLCTGS